MTTKDYLLKLKNEGILTEGQKNNKTYLHLVTPCKIFISEVVTTQLRNSYESNRESGGILVASPAKIGNETHLNITRVIFLKNISNSPRKSYLPDTIELREAINSTLGNQSIKMLPIRFHTHPTHSENPANEIFNYIFQSNTSEQDILVSDNPIPIDDLNLLMPRGLILCNGKSGNRMFIGFYNGLIAPSEFDTHKQNQSQRVIESIINKASEWSKEGKKKWWLIGGSLMLAILIIKYNKSTIPLILLLVAMIPLIVNDQHSEPQYFAQLSAGQVTIDIP